MSVNQREERWPTQSTTLLFTDAGVKFLATYRIWIVAAVWLGVRGYILWGLSPNYSIETYFRLAGDWLEGFTPYVDFKVEYPPGALFLFGLPRIFTEAPIVYGYLFAVVMLLADLGLLLLLWRIAALVRGGDTHADLAQSYESALICISYILFTSVFGRLLFQSYNLLLGLLLATSVYFALRKKAILVDILLAVGIWINLAVFVWIPLLWCYDIISRDYESHQKRSLKIGEYVRALLFRAAVLSGCLGVLFLPFYMLVGRPLSYIVQFHLLRGVQIESTAASILIMAAKILGFELNTDFALGAIHLTGVGTEGAAGVSGIGAFIVVGILTIYLIRMLKGQTNVVERNIWLIKGLLATILALLATSKVFLPQYLMWICPLAAFLACDHQPRISRLGWHLFGVNLISTVLFFFFYPNLIELEPLPAILLLIRNTYVIWLVIYLVLPDMTDSHQRKPFLQFTPSTQKYLIYIPVVLIFIWGTLAAFRPLMEPDIWMNLRVAEDILATGEIPTVDQYSAVAAGRPVIVHEWLSGLVFLEVYKLGGGKALTVFRSTMMLAMMFLLWFSLEKRSRTFILTAPLLAFTAYIILERVFVRPHLFTLLFLCIWIFCLQRWRRERRLWYLIILVPLQALWANLHGGYLIALALGAMMTGIAALLVLLPSWSKDESYSWSDVATLAALTAACLVAGFINPHGLRLIKFSLTMGFGSDFIERFVYEWGSPFAAKYMGRAYGFNVVLVIFITMFLGLTLNAKRRPLVDAIFAIFATVITIQAIRFVSYIGIFGFPIAVHAWQKVADNHPRSLLLKRHPLIETALIVLILISTLIYGFAYDKSIHRQIGWGFGIRTPYQTVDFLKKQNLEGVIFNDYTDGAFLIHHLAPKIRPVIDPRVDIYGSELTEEYYFSRENAVRFFRYLNKYNVSLILLMQTKKNVPIIQMLSQLPASRLLLRADDRFLFSYDPDLLPAEILQQ